jgi:hypothetical protein
MQLEGLVPLQIPILSTEIETACFRKGLGTWNRYRKMVGAFANCESIRSVDARGSGLRTLTTPQCSSCVCLCECGHSQTHVQASIAVHFEDTKMPLSGQKRSSCGHHRVPLSCSFLTAVRVQSDRILRANRIIDVFCRCIAQLQRCDGLIRRARREEATFCCVRKPVCYVATFSYLLALRDVTIS